MFLRWIRFIKERENNGASEIAIATKFAALPWRLGRQSVVSALKDSLSRLCLSSVDLYQLHWSFFSLTVIVFLSNFIYYLWLHLLEWPLAGQEFGEMKVTLSLISKYPQHQSWLFYNGRIYRWPCRCRWPGAGQSRRSLQLQRLTIHCHFMYFIK